MRATIITNQFNNPFHGSGYPRHVLPDELRQRIGRSGKLVFRFCHPAGFGKRDDACFLVVHPDKYAERFIYYFFTVSYYHTRLFLIGYEDTDFVLSICTPVLFFSARCKYIFIYIACTLH